MRNHIHPLTIISNLWRVFYLTIIPVLRGFFAALQGDFAVWLRGGWVDIIVFLLMIAVAVYRWWVVRYEYNDNAFTLYSGWIIPKTICIPWNKITTISLVESFYLRPFGAVKLRADTLGGGSGKPDFSIILSKPPAKLVLSMQRPSGSKLSRRSYTPHTKSVLSLALLTSNSFGGILFIAAFVSQSGRLLGREFSNMIIGTFEEISRVLAFGIPPAAAAIGYVLLFGWLAGFWMTFVRYKNFTVSRSNDFLFVEGGVFTSREYAIHANDVSFIDIRQSITTKLLKLYSLYISAAGYGKEKDDISCIIPTEDKHDFERNQQLLFPGFSASPRQFFPNKTGFMRFIGVPLEICIAIPAIMLILIYSFPSWRGFITFVGLMSSVPALLFLMVRFIEFLTSGFSKKDNFYTLRYSKGFYIHTVVVPADKVVCVELRQSPIQRITANCDLFFYTRAEKSFHHCCKNLNIHALKDFFNI